MNVARLCRLVPSALPHEYLGFTKLSLEGMLLSIELMTAVMKEENAATAAASGTPSAASRVAKHNANR